MAHLDEVRALLAAAAALLAALGPALSASLRHKLLGALVVAGLALTATAALGPPDSYDAVHHYLGARYVDELGYDGLYPALVAADEERALGLFEGATRVRLRDERVVSMDEAGNLGRQVHEQRFTRARWQAFGDDLAALATQRRSTRAWRSLLIDHGLNAPPGWLLLGGNLAALTPPGGLALLCKLDVVLLAGALWLLRRTLGVEVAAWTALYLLTAYTTRWPGLGAGVLRYDYLAALLAAVALAHDGRERAAGALVGLATALRFFPALWLLPLAAQVTRRSGARRALTAALLSAGLLLALSSAQRGVDIVPASVHHLVVHSAPEHTTSRRVGLATALAAWDERASPILTKAHRRQRAERGPWVLALGVGLTALLVGSARRQRLGAALELGPLALFLLATPSYYYFAVCATLIVRHARLRQGLVLAWLFATEAGTSALAALAPEAPRLQGSALSLGLCAYVLWQLWAALRGEAAPCQDKNGSRAPDLASQVGL